MDRWKRAVLFLRGRVLTSHRDRRIIGQQVCHVCQVSGRVGRQLLGLVRDRFEPQVVASVGGLAGEPCREAALRRCVLRQGLEELVRQIADGLEYILRDRFVVGLPAHVFKGSGGGETFDGL